MLLNNFLEVLQDMTQLMKFGLLETWALNFALDSVHSK